jgi:hypothetical protein
MPRLRIVAWFLALVTLVIYLPVRTAGFVYDDYAYVVNNPIVQKGLSWAGVRWAFTTGYSAAWHPLTWLSLMLDCQLFGMNPGAQHVVNVLFHSANAVLLLLLLFRLTGELWPSAFVAALFAWHPLRVESVAWIVERKDVLTTFFGRREIQFPTRLFIGADLFCVGLAGQVHARDAAICLSAPGLLAFEAFLLHQFLASRFPPSGP